MGGMPHCSRSVIPEVDRLEQKHAGCAMYMLPFLEVLVLCSSPVELLAGTVTCKCLQRTGHTMRLGVLRQK